MGRKTAQTQRREALFFGVSALALLAVAGPARANSAQLLAPATLSHQAQVALQQSAAAQAGTAGLQSITTQAQLLLSAQHLAEAAAAYKNAMSAQAAAAGGAGLTLGLSAGCLAPGLCLDPNVAAINASSPVVTHPDATHTLVTIDQSKQKALITWSEFDLPTNETLHFAQGGNATWITLNRVDAGTSPSKIFGAITAPGSVYVINQNGIIFGATAQVNVNSLIASSLDVGGPQMNVSERNAYFFNNGIDNPALGAVSTDVNSNGSSLFSFSIDTTGTINPQANANGGDVTINAGASIVTSLLPKSVSPDAGGFAFFFAPNVYNNGTVSTPVGETMMVAAQELLLTPYAYADIGQVPGGSTDPASVVSSTHRFTGVAFSVESGTTTPAPLQSPWLTTGLTGTVSNGGVITAERGTVILNGDEVTQGGVIQANTSITRNAAIFLTARDQLTLLPGSSTQELPDDTIDPSTGACTTSTGACETLPANSTATFTTPEIDLRGNLISFDSGSLIEAPGGTVTVTGVDKTGFNGGIISVAAPQISMAANSVIDVSGLAGVVVPESDNFITVKLFGNELADSPLQRNGGLNGQSITFDIRQGTSVATVSAIAAEVPLELDRLLTAGGTVSMVDGIGGSPNGNIVLNTGSLINFAGGYVQYLGGTVTASNLVTADGRIVSVSNANALDTFIGVAGSYTLDHVRWGSTTAQTYFDPLLAGSTYQPGYVEGHDAGGLLVDATSLELDGSIEGGVVAGSLQRQQAQSPTGHGTAIDAVGKTIDVRSLQANAGQMPSGGYFVVETPQNVSVQASPGSTSIGTVTVLSTDILSAGELGQITVTGAPLASGGTVAGATSGSGALYGSVTVASDADLVVAPGGIISLTGSTIEIDGTLTAHAGRISAEATGAVAGIVNGDITVAETTGNLTVGPTALLDASGLWVNDKDALTDAAIGSAYINGGTITLQTDRVFNSSGGGALNDTGNLSLEADSTSSALLNVSSGGYVTTAGRVLLNKTSGLAAGNGGSVALETYAGSGHFDPGFTTSSPDGALPTATVQLVTLAADDVTVLNETSVISDDTLDGHIKAFGFSKGGTFTLQAPGIRIGINPGGNAPGLVVFDPSFFDGNAFSSYNLSGISGVVGTDSASNVVSYGAVEVSADMILQQRNYDYSLSLNSTLAAIKTGADISQVVGLTTLPDGIRTPVNLALHAAAAPTPPTVGTVPPTLLVDAGVTIQGDLPAPGLTGAPASVINLTVEGQEQTQSNSQNTYNETVGIAEILGTIRAPGGTITIGEAANSSNTQGAVEVVLGTNSLLDVSGVAVINPNSLPNTTQGWVEGGGTVSIVVSSTAAGSGTTASSIVGMQGAVIDVSGATGSFDVLKDVAGGHQYVSTSLWSDAGSITLSAPTLLYEGSFAATSEGNGGSLSVISTDKSSQIVVQEDTTGLDTGNLTAGNVYFIANELAGSGIANLSLLSGGADSSISYAPGSIVFATPQPTQGGGAGNSVITVDVSNRLVLGASTIVSENSIDGSIQTVNLTASYVALDGGAATQGSSPTLPQAGTSILNVSGGTIDIAGATLGSFAAANFSSAGDIRLTAPVATESKINGASAAGTLGASELLTAGDLTLTAAQVYPVSDVDFTIKSLNGAVTFAGNQASATAAFPLSAGGQLTVDAATIVQDGVLRAPLGTIRLGALSSGDLSAHDPTGQSLVLTNAVTMDSGSITSVSLEAHLVPFGETTDGTSWTYNQANGVPLPTAPQEMISLAAGSITAASGAVVNLSGGDLLKGKQTLTGDIVASEFVEGTGGTKNILLQANAPAGSNVFAIIPGYNPGAAPVDFDFQLSSGNTLPVAGQSVYLAGVPGLAAGYYTLLPALYATLPGSYRVVTEPGSVDAIASQDRVLPDGSALVAGIAAQAVTDPTTGVVTYINSARTNLFEVQSSSVWRQYSQITESYGSTIFTAEASKSSGVAPRLPVDAGVLALDVTTSLDIQAAQILATHTGGRGAEVDIAAPNIEILAPGGTAASGNLGLDSSQLTSLGAETLLIGGTQVTSATSATIDPIATAITVDAGALLVAPEIILVTNDDGIGITVDGGSTIQAAGTLPAKTTTNVTISRPVVNTTKVNGDGALVSVSVGSALTLTQPIQPQNKNDGTLTIAAGGATLIGNSITLASTSSITIADDVSLSASGGTTQGSVGNLTLDASSINFGAYQNKAGLNIDQTLLAILEQSSNLTFRARTAIDFSSGTPSIGAPDETLTFDAATLVATGADSVTIAAENVDVINSGSGSGSSTAGTAALSVTATAVTTSVTVGSSVTTTVSGGDIVLGTGAKALSGFGTAAFDGMTQVAVTGTGSFSAGAANLVVNSPYILVGTNAVQAISTAGNIALAPTGGAASETAAIDQQVGGTINITAAQISDNTDIQALGGGIKLEATATGGDVSLGASARLEAQGFVQTYFDVTRTAGGGTVQLISDAGNVVAAAGAIIDVTSVEQQSSSTPIATPPVGEAGTIVLSAAQGYVDLNAAGAATAFDETIIAGVAPSTGGTLKIDARILGAVGSQPTTAMIAAPAAFSDTVDIHVGSGNLAVATNLTAHHVTLSADSGVVSIGAGTTIDANGAEGGSIAIYGGQSVLMSGGTLEAMATDPTQKGGDVTIGTSGQAVYSGGTGSYSGGTLELTGGTIDVSGGSAGGTVTLRAPLFGGTNIYDSANNTVAIAPVETTISGARSIVIDAFREFTTSNSGFTGTIDPAGQSAFYQTDLVKFVQNFSLANAGNFAALDRAVLNQQPDIDLVSSGDITVTSAWNLGAGTAGDLVNAQAFKVGGTTYAAGSTVVTDANGALLSQFSGYTGQLAFVDGVSQITSMDYRVGGSPQAAGGLSAVGEAGILTIQAGGNLTINADITDGFFNTENRSNPTYVTALSKFLNSLPSSTYVVRDVGGSVLTGDTTGLTLPLVPYDAAANGISPVATNSDPAPITGADLFPLAASGTAVQVTGSWSYRFVAGANTASADPLAVMPLTNGTTAGDVLVGGHQSVLIDTAKAPGIRSARVLLPTVIRTGTGSIDIAAGRDFKLTDDLAPGVVYAAGRNSFGTSAEFQSPSYTASDGSTVPVAANPDGFLQPDVLVLYCYVCANETLSYTPGVVTGAAFPVDGGDLTITAQRDIIGIEAPAARHSLVPYYATWLLAQGDALSDQSFGAFSAASGQASFPGSVFLPSQSAWWINFGTFDQGVMSVGGDVVVEAGRDIVQFSVSTPTTARVSGGLAANDLPVMHLNDSGNMTVVAGRNILGGAFYEGSGTATITVDGSVTAGWTSKDSGPVGMVLAVDTGTIDVVARGSVDLAGIVSPISLETVGAVPQTNSPGNVGGPFAFGLAVVNGSAFVSNPDVFLSSYGPNSTVSVESVSGDVLVNSLSNPVALIGDAFGTLTNLTSSYPNFPGINSYPASFSATAIIGSITVADSLQLTTSDSGSIDLLAYDSLSTYSLNVHDNLTDVPVLSTGLSIVEAVFNPMDPNATFGPSTNVQGVDLGPLLVHVGDTTPDRFYAVSGDIVSGAGLNEAVVGTDYKLEWEVTKPAAIEAGGDIIDLPFFGQNLATSDVTSVIAGGSIFYTGTSAAWGPEADKNFLFGLLPPENFSGLSLSGPGLFDVEAGGDLGPFVTPTADAAAAAAYVEGVVVSPITTAVLLPADAYGTGIIAFGNRVTVGNRLELAPSDALDQSANGLVGTRALYATGQNPLLASQSADIVALFGVKNAPNYGAVVSKYLDPSYRDPVTNQPFVRNGQYLTDLVSYIDQLDIPGLAPTTTTAAFNDFASLSPALQHEFIDMIFFDELTQTASTQPQNYSAGYAIIDTLFPPTAGYTDNSANANRKTGTNQPATQVVTGNLNLVHAVIKSIQGSTNTLLRDTGQQAVGLGGNIYILGPGGNITVGSLAIEPQSQAAVDATAAVQMALKGDTSSVIAKALALPTGLQISGLGIVTQGGGSINTFTDGSVLVDQSRILTVQGGDVNMWSSNADLDAGRGAKTSLSVSPLEVNFDIDNLETVDTSGLISGAGIGTIQSTPDAPPASATLIAPAGTVNFGDAGVRSTGNLLVAAKFVANAGNAQAAGSTSGVPVAGTVNLTAVVAGSNASGGTNAAAEEAARNAAAAQQGSKGLQATVSVKVLGYGCDDASADPDLKCD